MFPKNMKTKITLKQMIVFYYLKIKCYPLLYKLIPLCRYLDSRGWRNFF